MLLESWRERLAGRRAELAARMPLVLCGGGSQEREVSLRSGHAVHAALERAAYPAALVTLAGDNISIEALKLALPAGDAPAQGSLALAQGASILSALRSVPSLVLSTMHGQLGENGAWQGLLELLDLPYVSAGVKGSALGMDKIISKRLFEQLGIPTPQWWIQRRSDSCRGLIDAGVAALVAKPVAEGSSVGVLMAQNDDAGWREIEALNQRFDPLLIEERIQGRELTASLIGPSHEALALPLVEILPGDHFYSYEAKYSGVSRYDCPANVEAGLTGRIQELARQVYGEFELGPYARIDVLLDDSGQPYFLEANTLPGFTEHSLLPMAARAAGIEMGELLELLMLFALERWESSKAEARTGA
ncbi:ATP-grasp domain-containing protein [bacterium]|nr:ATP-grasp domain-containing protein [bacterium]